MLGWLFLKLGWLPHRWQKWATQDGSEVRVHFRDHVRVLTAGEAKWLGAELILAGRKAAKVRQTVDQEAS